MGWMDGWIDGRMAKLHQRLVVLHTTTQVAINTSLEQSGGAPAVGLTSPRGGLLIYRPDPPPPSKENSCCGINVPGRGAMEAAERGCSGRPDPKETGRPNPTGNYCVFFPTGCFSPPNFSRRLSISPKMHFLLLKRIFLSAPQAKKIFDPPSPGCFAPPDVFPPPKNFGRVGGEKHADATGSQRRTREHHQDGPCVGR